MLSTAGEAPLALYPCAESHTAEELYAMSFLAVAIWCTTCSLQHHKDSSSYIMLCSPIVQPDENVVGAWKFRVLVPECVTNLWSSRFDRLRDRRVTPEQHVKPCPSHASYESQTTVRQM